MKTTTQIELSSINFKCKTRKLITNPERFVKTAGHTVRNED